MLLNSHSSQTIESKASLVRASKTGGVLAALCLLLGACGADDGEEPPEFDLAAAVEGLCADEPRADVFSAGMAKQTPGGVSISIAESMPSPPERTDHDWQLMIKDSSGAPLVGAEVTLRQLMPDHGHGSPRKAVITELGDGLYQAAPVTLSMPGFWTIDIGVSGGSANLAEETTQFGFCVQ